MLENTFKNENNILFQNIINEFSNFFKKPLTEQERIVNTYHLPEPAMELFITPSCNQNCEYCYLQKNKDQLYPPEYNNKDLILSNLKLLLQYFVDEKFSFLRFDFFSGEIFGYPYGNEVLDILLEYMDKGLEIRLISIPTNASFCFSPEIIKLMDSYITKFQRKGAHLSFSISYDGPVLDKESRPVKDNKILKNDTYLNQLCNFMKRHHYGFHPMISSNSIELQIENYKEWTALIQKYFPYQHTPLESYGLIMQLETREAGWTAEKITEYLKWLKFYIDTDLEVYFQNNIQNFNKHVIHGCSLNDLIIEEGFPEVANNFWNSYTPYILDRRGPDLGCSLGHMVIVRLGDLAICPCHRTSYNKFILGHYEIDENTNKISHVSCENLPLASAIYVTGFNTKPKCYDCALNSCCPKYCIGANFEANQELFYPEESNCELQKAKLIFLYNYYKKLNLDESEVVSTTYNNLRKTEPEVINKWSTIIQSLI